MTEEEIAKIAFAEMIMAIEKVRENYVDDYTIQFPGMIMVNSSVYEFRKSRTLGTYISNSGKDIIPD
jgi:hypothetical protein